MKQNGNVDDTYDGFDGEDNLITGMILAEINVLSVYTWLLLIIKTVTCP